ncbi:disintegrin and metalloproteinase domain-containing protein 10-like [Rhineura floridana]|uniref:disintegrin and metalloproteinase domain-containing protein 10-like n=1 Tax=Rhineura floridana TaxID=261503 RepID=UPI002AC82F21|nr:disintegrin and metalloproteinase domain-containing protein 10-like [Rhineura floridana]
MNILLSTMLFLWYLTLPFWNVALSRTGSAREAEHRRAFVKYHETLSYDRGALEKMCREAKEKGDRRLILLEFKAYWRVFRMRLSRDRSVFARGFEITRRKGDSEPVDVSFIYSGDLQGEPGSLCHGSIINGLFEGFIRTWNGTYYIESAGEPLANQTSPGHSLIHHERDLDYPLWGDAESVSLARRMHQRLQDSQRELTAKAPQHSLRQKRSLDYSKTSCLLHVQADHLFYRRFGSIEAVVAQIASYVKAVNAIYEGAEFDGIQNIDFKVKAINIIEEGDRSESPFISPEMLLMLHSKANWNSYCLAFLLTDRDYSGVLGIAFNGQPGDSGGICSKQRYFQDKEVSLNTGLITLQKYGQLLAPRMIHITLAHELGHSLGAYHDESKECSRFDIDTTRGKYLMFSFATDGGEFNNDKFSPCSIAYIANILRVKKDVCFAETDRPICGNRIVDPGEECDVGNEDADACCYGPAEPSGIRCRLKPGALCSPSQGLCCSHECVPKPRGERCQAETDCASESVCSGEEAKCPAALPKANFILCAMQSRVCLNGLCMGSLCIQHGLEQCDCVSVSLRERCQLCCQLPEQAGTCASTTSPTWGRFFNGSEVPLIPGSPCGEKTGYCDRFHVCRFVDEDGPVARVKNFILDFIEMEDVATWMKTHWWAVLLVILTLAAMMAATVFLFGRTVDTETDEKARVNKKKNSPIEQRPENRHSFFYWEHQEIFIEAIRQEYETII